MNIVVTKTVNGVLAGRDGFKKRAVGVAHRIELGVAFLIHGTGPAQVVEFFE